MLGFNNLPNEYKLPWTAEQYLYNAGETTGYTNRLQGDGITITLNKQEYQYDCFDIDFRKYAHLDWVIKFDTNDMSHALAHSTDGTIRFLLTEKYVQPMALVERSEGDAKQLSMVRNYNLQLKETVMNEMEQDSSLMLEMFADNPQLNDTLAKMTLVDSMGQHKDRRNQQRINQKAVKVIEKQERKLIAEVEADKKIEYNNYLDSKMNFDEYL